MAGATAAPFLHGFPGSHRPGQWESRVAWGQLSWQALAGKLALPSPFLTESLPQPAGRRNHPEVLIELSQGCREAQKTDVSPSSCG